MNNSYIIKPSYTEFSPESASVGSFLKLPIIDEWCDVNLIQAVTVQLEHQTGLFEVWLCGATGAGEIYVIYSEEQTDQVQAEANAFILGQFIADNSTDQTLQCIPHFNVWINPALLVSTKSQRTEEGYQLALHSLVPGTERPVPLYTNIYDTVEDMQAAREEVGRFIQFAQENSDHLVYKHFHVEEEYDPTLPDHEQADAPPTVH